MFLLSVPFRGACTSEGGRPPASRAPLGWGWGRLLSSTYIECGLDQYSTSTWNPINMMTAHFQFKQGTREQERKSNLTWLPKAMKTDIGHWGLPDLLVQTVLDQGCSRHSTVCLFYLGFQGTGLVCSSLMSSSRYLNMALLQGKRSQKKGF